MSGVLIASLSACGLSGGDDDALVVYNAQHESLTREWADAFTEETGVKVELRNGSDFDLGNQLVAEGDASKADVYLTENSPAISMVADKGLLAPVEDQSLAQVPEQYRPSTGDWVGIAARSTVFVYNEQAVAEEDLPKSFADLATPRWQGKWGAAPAGADFQAIVSAALELSGEQQTRTWLESLRRPDGGFSTYKGNKPILAAVNAGEIDGGVIYHYYYFGDRAGTGESSQNVGQYYFRNGGPESFLSLSGGGVLGTAPHAEEAQRFLAFITSQKGQEILRDSSFEYPVASGVSAAPELVPLPELNAPDVDPAGLNGPAVTDLLTSIGLA
ncbi:iron ABC transporter substrate-binding protein [Dietzia sp. ANT_WB102]|nr:iron ABC transporter substrate-binding protein [Dietzia sp. ANT_WB102]